MNETAFIEQKGTEMDTANAQAHLLAEGWEQEPRDTWEKVVDGWLYRLVEDEDGLWTLINMDTDNIIQSSYDLELVMDEIE